ncbi:MAG: hypothetical protein U0L25_01710 [Ligilactobacillus ruminis]|jgi:hypothetical protein|nr:hypothetical protein [Ligilactobacillus ruminis]
MKEIEKMLKNLKVEDIVTGKEDSTADNIQKAQNRHELQMAFEKYCEGR